MAPNKPPPPPRALNVQKFAESRAPELESLHSVISARLNHDFRVGLGKRRRTTGHRTSKNRRRKLAPRGGEAAEATSDKDPKKLPRRVRRRKELTENPASGFCTSGDGTKRLRTHLWHAKRFTMVKRWGFHLPLGLQGRGRGSRAVFKWLKSGALVHDASYCIPIELEGPEDSILAILKTLLLPSPLGATDLTDGASSAVRYGVFYENAMLYHAGAHFSKLISPVIYMWRPFSGSDGQIKSEHYPVLTKCSTSSRSEQRQLWIWIHAAAFKEGFDELWSACQQMTRESGAPISCFSLEGQIAKLEIMGSKAIQVLQKILRPISESGRTSDQSLLSSDSRLQKSYVLDHADKFPSRTIVSLTAHDPRELPHEGAELVEERSSTGPGDDMQNGDVQDLNTIISGVSSQNDDTMLSLWSQPEVHGDFLSDNKDLWDSSNKLHLPIPERILCGEKHSRRLNSFYLDLPNGKEPAIKAADAYSRACSLLLLKHKELGKSGSRWSIILPLSWLKVFWISLISCNARAIGLREKRRIACDDNLPYFPFDFPDCKAYSSLMAAEAASFDKEAELRPIAVRPLKIPIPPPWNCLIPIVNRGTEIIRNCQTLDVQHPDGEVTASASMVNPENSESLSSTDEASASFRGLVIRTSNALKNYTERSDALESLLFSNMNILDKSFSELIDTDPLKRVTRDADLMPTGDGLCSLRVMLHAFKEGMLEEGAIVCAPILADLSVWTSRTEDHVKLQIPQASVRSYFTQQDSGNWELQVPKDSLTMESFRWPIGFVTTGFVRGSKKLVAEAFCEARLLSLLRWQQWDQMKAAKSEIFVLVRNLKSASYRRALATIVLEQQKEDLEFM